MKEPVIQKFDFAAMPIVSLAVRSTTLSPRELTTLADRKIKRRLESIPGVAKAKLVGVVEARGRRQPRPGAARGARHGRRRGRRPASPSENVNTPLGRLTQGGTEMPLRISGKPSEPAELRAMVIGRRGGDPIRLGDVADVEDTVEEQRSLALINGEPAVAIDIIKQTKANTVGVVDAVHGRGRGAAAPSCRRAPRSRSSATPRSSSASRSPTSRTR